MMRYPSIDTGVRLVAAAAVAAALAGCNRPPVTDSEYNNSGQSAAVGMANAPAGDAQRAESSTAVPASGTSAAAVAPGGPNAQPVTPGSGGTSIQPVEGGKAGSR